MANSRTFSMTSLLRQTPIERANLSFSSWRSAALKLLKKIIIKYWLKFLQVFFWIQNKGWGKGKVIIVLSLNSIFVQKQRKGLKVKANGWVHWCEWGRGTNKHIVTKELLSRINWIYYLRSCWETQEHYNFLQLVQIGNYLQNICGANEGISASLANASSAMFYLRPWEELKLALIWWQTQNVFILCFRKRNVCSKC